MYLAAPYMEVRISGRELVHLFQKAYRRNIDFCGSALSSIIHAQWLNERFVIWHGFIVSAFDGLFPIPNFDGLIRKLKNDFL
jgi:hypothetical protein